MQKNEPSQARIIEIDSLDIREHHTQGTSHSNNISLLKHPRKMSNLPTRENKIIRGEKDVKLELGAEIELQQGIRKLTEVFSLKKVTEVTHTRMCQLCDFEKPTL